MAEFAEKILPLVLIFRPFPFISSYQERFSKQFQSLPYVTTFEDRYSKQSRSLNSSSESFSSSLMPILNFLTTYAQSVRALVCSSFTPVTFEILGCLPSLECVVTTSTGVEHIDLDECRRRGIVVANTGEAFSEDVADYAVGLLIDVLRRISPANRFVRNGFWPVKGEFSLGSKLRGKRVGIVGLGSIGSKVAKRLEAFGCIMSYNSRRPKPYVPYPYYSNVYDLAFNSDVLIVCCTWTDETYHIINKEVMSALGKGGVIINVGRGALIDEKELVQCLVEGEIGGAGLDVFENEPDVPIQLFDMDNVVLSPHRAALTPESRSALHEIVIANLEAFFSNKPLPSLVRNA